MRTSAPLAFLAALWGASALLALQGSARGEDVAWRTVEGQPGMRYVLHAARAPTPEAGHALLLVLPGGDGSEAFSAFVARIHERAAPEDVLTVQLVAPRFGDDQRIVWPTGKNPVKDMAFTTEAYVRAVVEEVSRTHRIDASKVWLLAWSSGGPAAYAALLEKDGPVRGAFVAMSVFKPDLLGPLEPARGRAVYLLHSEADRVCPYRMAVEAHKRLEAAGARVTLVTYEGGHGWHGPVFDRIRAGLAWLGRRER